MGTERYHRLNLVVLVDADGVVRVRSRYIAVLPDRSLHNGDYFDIFRSTPDGWRISYRMSAARFPRIESVPLPESFVEAWRPAADRLPEIVH